MLFLSDYLPLAACVVSGCYFGLQMVLEANRTGMRKFLFYFVLFCLADAGAVTAWEHLDFLAELEPVTVCETDLECELWESTKGAE